MTPKQIPQGTSLKQGGNVLSSRDCIIASLSGIPVFTADDLAIDGNEIGQGRFGSVKLATINKLNLKVAMKVIDTTKSTTKNVLAEAIVCMSLSGHNSFPYCFGMLNDNAILLEYLGTVNGTEAKTYPTLAQLLRKGVNVECLKGIFNSVFKAISFMHSKKILHNDIKSDNIVVAESVKIIDFGKATMTMNPVTYNIIPGTKNNTIYNKRHRHLAHELRNIPGSKQSFATDTYSIGFMLKHAAAVIKFSPLIELGRIMKRQDPVSRVTINNALDKIQMI